MSKSVAERFRRHATGDYANVVFAALITGGGTFRVFVTNRLLRNFRFIAPEYLFIEFMST
ncbi:MAG: hypothetical protein KIH09_06995 [Candidatus Freyarchaeota archaeon]|nr:hypothetical protein [Candidatus Jordarchaeia archaeon]